jgi:hypothetical protein
MHDKLHSAETTMECNWKAFVLYDAHGLQIAEIGVSDNRHDVFWYCSLDPSPTLLHSHLAEFRPLSVYLRKQLG